MDIHEIHTMIDDCMKRESKMTDWERGFISSLYEQFDNFTPKQIERLNIIWEKIT